MDRKGSARYVLCQWPSSLNLTHSNLNLAIDHLAEKMYPGVNAEQIIEGNRDAILHLIWVLIQVWMKPFSSDDFSSFDSLLGL